MLFTPRVCEVGHSMKHSTVTERASDSRVAVRRNVYLAAVVESDGLYAPVRIRNISATGALIDSPASPGAHCIVKLIRGSLMTQGRVAWSQHGRFGIQFSHRVAVDKWLAPPINIEQNRVDEIVRLVKDSGLPPPPIEAQNLTCAATLGEEVVETSVRELGRAAELLKALGTTLVDDAALVSRHAGELQNIDIAVQIIDRVVGSLTTEATESRGRTQNRETR